MAKLSLYKTIQKKTQGTIIFRQDFPGYHTEYVGAVLSEMVETGALIRLAQGIYYKPVITELGVSYPFADTITAAICKRDHAKFLPSGAAAANKLGLSEQVPTRHIYLTNGTARELKLGNQTIVLKHVSPSHFAFKDKVLPILLQAMKWIGAENITNIHVAQIGNIINSSEHKKNLHHDLVLFPAWARNIIKKTLTNENMD